MVKLLLDKGANMNTIGHHGHILLIALQTGHGNIVRLLLDKGADMDARDSYGFTALRRALQLENKNVAQLLVEYGAQRE
jgi:ankyrin repeat domain-containing protein 50